ncbi:MAG: hypothetical protein ABIF71_13325 [Planctomycetota bacterium]
MLALAVYGLPLVTTILLFGAITPQPLLSRPIVIAGPFLFATGSFLAMWCGSLR